MKYDSEHFVIWSRTKTVNKKIKENKTCRGNLWLICGIFHCNISTRQLRVQITTILYNYIFVNAKFVVFASIYPFLDQPLSWRNNSRRRHSNFSLLQLASFILELKLCQSLKRLSSSKYFVLDYGEAMTKKTSTVFRFPPAGIYLLTYQQWKHQNGVWNLLNVNNKNNVRMMSKASFWCLLG